MWAVDKVTSSWLLSRKMLYILLFENRIMQLRKQQQLEKYMQFDPVYSAC